VFLVERVDFVEYMQRIELLEIGQKKEYIPIPIKMWLFSQSGKLLCGSVTSHFLDSLLTSHEPGSDVC